MSSRDSGTFDQVQLLAQAAVMVAEESPAPRRSTRSASREPRAPAPQQTAKKTRGGPRQQSLESESASNAARTPGGRNARVDGPGKSLM